MENPTLGRSTKNPGISRLLTGSRRKPIFAASNFAAAYCRFSTSTPRAFSTVTSLGKTSSETIELRTVERLSVFDGFAHAVAEFRNAVGLAGYSPFAARPVARRQVVENELEAVVLQSGSNGARDENS